MIPRIRPRCLDCGGKIYPDTDRDWGTFGQMCCSACGWDDGKLIDPAFLKLPPQHPGIGTLSTREQMVLAWIMQSRHPFKSISHDIEAACEKLCQHGYATAVIDNGEACYVPADAVVTH